MNVVEQLLQEVSSVLHPPALNVLARRSVVVLRIPVGARRVPLTLLSSLSSSCWLCAPSIAFFVGGVRSGGVAGGISVFVSRILVQRMRSPSQSTGCFRLQAGGLNAKLVFAGCANLSAVISVGKISLALLANVPHNLVVSDL